MAQQETDVLDSVKLTQKNLGKAKFTMAASDLQDHVFFNSILSNKKLVFDSGSACQWNVMTTHGGACHVTGLFAQETPNYVSVMQQASVPWRHITSNYIIDDRLVSMNRDPSKIVDLVTVGRTQMMVGIAEAVEGWGWTDTAAADTDNPLGVPYYIVTNASEGFNGGNPTYASSAGAGGLDSATYTRWRNYSGGNYTSVSKADLIRRMRRAAVMTKFKNPRTISAPEYGKGTSRGIYTNYDVISGCEEVLEDQNDNLGNDLASKDGATMFRGTPLTHVPYLDSAAGQAAKDPVYAIDWNTFELAVLRGEFLKKMGPIRPSYEPRTIITYRYMTYNLRCTDRRKQWVVQKA